MLLHLLFLQVQFAVKTGSIPVGAHLLSSPSNRAPRPLVNFSVMPYRLGAPELVTRLLIRCNVHAATAWHNHACNADGSVTDVEQLQSAVQEYNAGWALLNEGDMQAGNIQNAQRHREWSNTLSLVWERRIRQDLSAPDITVLEAADAPEAASRTSDTAAAAAATANIKGAWDTSATGGEPAVATGAGSVGGGTRVKAEVATSPPPAATAASGSSAPAAAQRVKVAASPAASALLGLHISSAVVSPHISSAVAGAEEWAGCRFQPTPAFKRAEPAAVSAVPALVETALVRVCREVMGNFMEDPTPGDLQLPGMLTQERPGGSTGPLGLAIP
jgi:hypothetical protein